MKIVIFTMIVAVSAASMLRVPSARATNVESLNYLRNNLDYLRDSPDYLSFLYKVKDGFDEFSDPALTKVTRDFGFTSIPLGKLPIRSGMGDSGARPWSSYWFPAAEKELFQSEKGPGESPLEKYDLVRSRVKGVSSKATKIERDLDARSTFSIWDGLCDAWAIASLLVPEPQAPVTARVLGGKSATFSVADQKALLLKSFEGLPTKNLEVYGQRFTGDSNQVIDGLSYGWIQPDILPEQFHRFVEVALFEKKVPFVMDHDPKEAIWSEPVPKANYVVTAVKGRSDVVLVTMYLFPTRPLTRENKEVVGVNQTVRTYQYLLFGENDRRGNLIVDSGVWLSKEWLARSPEFKDDVELRNQIMVDSRKDHPDYVFLVKNGATAGRQPLNPEVDPKIVDDIFKGKLQ